MLTSLCITPKMYFTVYTYVHCCECNTKIGNLQVHLEQKWDILAILFLRCQSADEGFKMEDYVGYTSRDLNAHYSYSGTSRNSFFEHVY